MKQETANKLSTLTPVIVIGALLGAVILVAVLVFLDSRAERVACEALIREALNQGTKTVSLLCRL